jgi:putative RNA 2'-phosphotransferase
MNLTTMTAPHSPNQRDLVARSKHLSWLLRHGAVETGLAMDPAGWAEVEDVLAQTRMTRAQLEEAVRTNTKGRLQLEGDRVRACQGHSQANTAVDRDALERSWHAYTGDASLWHGTSLAAIESIATAGILPIARTHVHLTGDPASKVGKRAAVAWLLEIDPARVRAAGLAIFVAPNGVVLTRAVPPGCIVGARAMTKRAAADEAEVCARLGLPR